MRSQLSLALLLVISLTQCDQTPTTLDEEPYLGDSDDITFSLEINRFEFDYLSRQFFLTVEVTSPLAIDQVTFSLASGSVHTNIFLLNDLAQGADILIGDGLYDGSWHLPDSMFTYIDSLWSLEVLVRDVSSNELSDSRNLQPTRPAPPLLGTASHVDTLTLLTDGLVLDTLTLEVSHPRGLDEIKSVSMMSLKPDGSYANGGNPIPLYDDGGKVVFYSFGGIDFTSGDTLANDGVYSLLLALSPGNLSGVYHWTFNAKTWLGIEAIPVLDSVVVLPAGSLSRNHGLDTELRGVFN